MRNKKFVVLFCFFIFVLALSTVLSVFVFTYESTAEMIIFSVTINSLIISLLAFIISIKTYFSIDSVNVLTKMDGNVLENQNYVTSITCLLKEYNHRESISVCEALVNKLDYLFKKRSSSALEFANNLQYFIDLLVFFPSLFQSKDENQKENMKKINQILNLIERKKETFMTISTGNLLLIDETVKLIKGVLGYQQLTKGKEYNTTSSLLDVRGNMLKNSVTQTVYYDYLGLMYNKKAMFILRERLNLTKKDIFDITVLKELIANIHLLNDEELELYLMYLLESKKAFKKALDLCSNDLMWEAYIKYNDARSTFFLYLIDPDNTNYNWEDIMNEAIIARNRLNMLIQDILGNNHSHLQESFIYQEYLARLVNMNLLIALNKDITHTNGKTKYKSPDYHGINKDRFIFPLYTGKFDIINDYQNNILNYIYT